MQLRPALALTVSSALAVGLAGCASAGSPSDDGRITVLASTSVYGQIAEEIGGESVEVSSIITSQSQDPHAFEPSAQDQLSVSRADLILENGGGYDAFIDALIESSGSGAPVLTAVEFSHDWPENEGHSDAAEDAASHGEDADAESEDGHDHDHADHGHVEGFNEHVWYDPHTMEHFAEAIAEELSELLPEQARAFHANAERFAVEIAGLEASLDDIAGAHAGDQVFLTEPVPAYLVEAAALENVTPDAFSEAVEEGQDVPPATLLEALKILRSGDVRVVIANAQTGGAETQQVVDEADAGAIPVLQFTETLPDGQTYLSWMQENIAELRDALA